MKRIAWVCCIACLGLASVGITGCGKSPDMPVIASGSEYSDRLEEAQKLSQSSIEKFERGESLTDEEKEKLEQALKIFNGLIAFNPEGFGAHFGAGKIHQILGDSRQALIDMKNFVELAPENPKPEFKPLIAEAYYTSGLIYESNAEFDRAESCAEAAVKNFRENPNYLALLASAKLRAKKVEEAKKLVAEALKLDPNHGRAKQLRSMLN